MFKALFKIIFYFIGFVIILGILGTIFKDTPAPVKEADIDSFERLERQTKSVQACVQTFGKGVYADKPLKWKLLNCNAKP